MIRIQLDQSWRERLQGLNQTIEFCDEDGKVVGQFVPSEDHRMQEARRSLLQVSDEEWARIRNEEGEYSTEEVLKSLENS